MIRRAPAIGPCGRAAEAVGSTPEELGAFFAREVVKYAKIIAKAHIRAD